MSPPATAKNGNPVKADKAAPFAGLVFKTISDPFTGKVSLIRVFSGTFKPDTFYFNSSKEVEERVAGLFLLQGKTQESAGEVQAGDIVAVAKLKETQTGDTLTDQGRQDPAAGDHLPRPVHLLRHRAQGPRRRGQDLHRPAAHHGGGPDHQDAARPADQGTGHLGQRPAARRTGGQQAEAQVRRGSDDEAAQDRLPRDRAWASPTSKRNTRSRAAAAASTATC